MTRGPSAGDSLDVGLVRAQTADVFAREVIRESVRHRLFGTPEVQLGRFRVLHRLGEGGMGIVYAAEDPRLQRTVALKVLRGSKRIPRDREQARLLREARALARLRHPNVVQVYEVGTWEGQVYVAMEFVEGQTLRTVIEQDPPPWSDVVDLMVEAGAGLAAAHRVGLVHRDFKPENVLVGEGGRAQVADFGLASIRAGATTAGTPTVPDSEPSGSSTPHDHSTMSRTLVGTPSYMAPEQFEHGTEPDPRSDQFSFCVTLLEALYGRFPYPLSPDATARAAKRNGRLLPAPRGRSIPRWLQRIVVRGLSADPAHRYPDMDDLLADIQRSRSRSRRRWSVLAVTGTIVGVSVVAAAWGSRHSESTPPIACTSVDDPLRAHWSGEIAEGLAPRYAALGAQQQWDWARTVIDEWATRWATMRREACEATRIHGTQSDELLDLRMHCLDRNLAEAVAVLDTLSQPDAERVGSTLSLVSRLPGLDECLDTEGLREVAPIPRDSERAAAIVELHSQLGLVHAMFSIGQFDEALALSNAVVERAQTLGHQPTLAKALRSRGTLRRSLDEPERAVTELEQAALAAERGRDDRTKAGAWIDAAFISAHDLEQFDRAQRWIDYAAAAVERLDHATSLRAELANTQGVIHERRGEDKQALAAFERAAELSRSLDGTADPNLESITGNLGAMYLSAGRIDRALELMQESLALARRHYGDDHPTVAISISNIATVRSHAGEFAQAAQDYRTALEIMQRTQGADSQNVARAHSNYGSTLADLGRYDEAFEHQRRALEIFERTLEPDHSQLMVANGEIGRLQVKRGHPGEAIEALRAALAIAERLDNSKSRAFYLRGIATALVELGEIDAASKHIEQAIALAQRDDESLRGRESVLARVQQAEIELRRGRPRAALRAAEAGVEVAESGPQLRPELRGRLAFVHARALWDTKAAAEARTRAAEALALFEQDPRPAMESMRERIRRWIAERDDEDRQASQGP